MAVKAKDQVTLATLPVPTYTRLFYLKQASTLSPPSVPTVNPPPAPWSTTEPTYAEGSTDTVYTVMFTAWGSSAFEYGPVQKSVSFEAAKAAYNKALAAQTAAGDALFVANVATEIATGNFHVGTAEEPPVQVQDGMIWFVTNGSDMQVGMWTYRGGEWKTYTQMVGLQIVPGVDGVPTVIDGTGLYSPQATLEVLRSELFYADVAGVRTLVVTGIPRENMAADVGAALAEAERVGGVITMTTRKGIPARDEDPNEDIPQLVLARERAVGAPLSGVIIEPTTLDFVVDGEATVSLDGPRSLMTAENVYVRDTIQIGEHQVRTLPGTNVTVFQHVGSGI